MAGYYFKGLIPEERLHEHESMAAKSYLSSLKSRLSKLFAVEQPEQQEPVMVPFKYGGYWDVPRTLIFWHRAQLFLLTSYFDEDLDDYEPDYSIYRLPAWVAKPIVESSSWKVLEEEIGAEFLGTIPVRSVNFDSTHRSTIDPRFIDAYLQTDSDAEASRTP